MDELELVRSYGVPDYTGFVDNQKVYMYKVRDNKYIILFGLYNGYDLVVTCKDSIVTDVKRVERPSTFALLQPVPWAVTN